MSERTRPITGVQKVAAFLLSLDKDVSAKVLRHIDPKVIPEVAEAMTHLAPELCTPDAVDGIYDDLAQTVYKRTGVRSQDDFELHEILASTFGPDTAERVLRDIHTRRRQEQPFGFLEHFNPQVVARVLHDESPAIVSLILAHVSPAVSAAVLGVLEEGTAFEIVKRMTAIMPPGIETMLAIADDLQERVRHMSTLPAPPDPTESLRTIAELLNHAAGGIEQSVLEGLEEVSAEMASQVREFMFTWDDLGTIEKRAMQKILASVDTRTLSIALKACPPAVESNVMDNLSSRVREMVADERELSGALPMTEVAAARNEIMAAVRALMEAGEFSPARAGEELVS
jgi:flagellar motor switch protein FliG